MAKNAPKIYHHSSVKGTIFKIVIIAAAIALILALTAFFGFRKYIAYTDTGKLYLDIPWLYGYMDGKPEYDELAPYFEPVVTSKPDSEDLDASPDSAGSGNAASPVVGADGASDGGTSDTDKDSTSNGNSTSDSTTDSAADGTTDTDNPTDDNDSGSAASADDIISH